MLLQWRYNWYNSLMSTFTFLVLLDMTTKPKLDAADWLGSNLESRQITLVIICYVFRMDAHIYVHMCSLDKLQRKTYGVTVDFSVCFFVYTVESVA